MMIIGLESVSQPSLDGALKGHNSVRGYRRLLERCCRKCFAFSGFGAGDTARQLPD